MSIPPILTSPSAFASGLASCIRFKQRMNVDFPQPDGPMTAVAWFASTEILLPCSASVLPNQSFRLCTSTAGSILPRASQHTPHEYEPHQSGRSHDEDHQHQCPRPRLANPILKWRSGIRENLQRQGSDRLIWAQAPELVAESR